MPGGKWEEGDANDAYTALREANEEIGLDPSIVDVVTVLHPFYSKVNKTPFHHVLFWSSSASLSLQSPSAGN